MGLVACARGALLFYPVVGARQKRRWRFLSQKNRGAVALQRNVAARAPRMRGEFPATPRVRAGRGIDTGCFAWDKKLRAPSLALRGP